MWEVNVRSAVIFAAASSISQCFSTAAVPGTSVLSISEVCSYASSCLFAADWALHRSRELKAYWRTLPLFAVNGFISHLYFNKALLLLTHQCRQSTCEIHYWFGGMSSYLIRLLVFIDDWAVPVQLHLYKYLSMKYLCLLLALLTALLLWVFPVPSLPALKGRYSRVGTANFALPMKLSSRKSQLYKGNGQLVNPPEQIGEEEVEEYEVAVQCWFPMLTQESLLRKLARCAGMSNAGAGLWSSGHKETELQELRAVLHGMSKLGGVPAWMFEQLALAVTNAEHVESMEGIFGLDSASTSFGEDVAALDRWEASAASAASGEGGLGASGDSASAAPSQCNPLTHTTPFPIAIYSHGNYGWRQVSASACEALASEGYVVFSMDHAPSAMCARPVPPATRKAAEAEDASPFVYYDYALPKGVEPGTLMERDHYAGGLDRKVREIESLVDHLCSSARPRADGEDEDEMADQVEVRNSYDSTSDAEDDHLSDAHWPPAQSTALHQFHADVDKICLFGHSYGAGSAVSTACRDRRIRAVVALDPWMYPAKDAYVAATDSLYTVFSNDDAKATTPKVSLDYPSGPTTDAPFKDGDSRSLSDAISPPRKTPDPYGSPGSSTEGEKCMSLPSSGSSKREGDRKKSRRSDDGTVPAPPSAEKEWYEGEIHADDDIFSDTDDSEETTESEGDEADPGQGAGEGAGGQPLASPQTSPRRESVTITPGVAMGSDPRNIVIEQRRSSLKSKSLRDATAAAVAQLEVEEEDMHAVRGAASLGRGSLPSWGDATSTSNSGTPFECVPDGTFWQPCHEHLLSPAGPKILMLSAEHWQIGARQAPFRQAFKKKCHWENVFSLINLGTNHQNFCDVHLAAAAAVLRSPSGLGPVDPFANVDATNEVLASFFSQAVAGPSYNCSSRAARRPLSEAPNPAAPKSSETARLISFMYSKPGLSRSTSFESVASSIDDDQLDEVAHAANHGLHIAPRKRYGLRPRAKQFVDENFRDEAVMPACQNWDFVHYVLPSLKPSAAGDGE